MGNDSLQILYVVHGFPPSEAAGAEIYAYHVARGMRERGHDARVFCPGNDPKRDEYQIFEETYEGIPVLRVNNTWRDLHRLMDTVHNAEIARIFGEILDEARPDLVHVQHTIGTTAEVLLLPAARGIPVVATLHDYWFHCPRGQRLTPRGHLCTKVQPWRCSLCVFKKRGRYGFDWSRDFLQGRTAACGERTGLTRFLRFPFHLAAEIFSEAGPRSIHRRNAFMAQCLKSADLLLCPSKFLAEEYRRQGAPEDRLVFWENGMDPEPFRDLPPRKSPWEGSRPIRFGFVGTLIPSKGPEVLVRAFQGIAPGLATLDIHGAGGGPNAARFERGLRRMNRHPDVRFHGRFEHGRLPEVLSRLDVLVQPSLWFENAPLTLHEAAMAGLAVVTSDLGGMAEFAGRFGNALTFPRGDVSALRSVLERLIGERDLLPSLVPARRAVRTLDDDVEGLLKHYRALIEGRRRRTTP